MFLKTVKGVTKKLLTYKAYLPWLVITLLIVWGGILRTHNLSTQPYWMDEGYTINAVLSVLEYGSTVLDSGQHYSCPTYCYPTAWIVEQLGDRPASYRLLATIAGILFILVIFFVARTFFNTPIALVSSFLVSFSYWQIAWSQQARWYTLFALFFWLALYFLYRLLYEPLSTTKKIVFGCCSALFSLGAVLTHGLGYLLPIICIGWLLIDRIVIKRQFDWRPPALILAGGTLAIAVLKVFADIDIIGFLLNHIDLHYVLPYYLSFYLRTYWLFIALALLAIFNLRTEEQRPAWFLLFVLGIYLVPLSFLTGIVHYRYLFHLTPIFFMLGACGITGIWHSISHKIGKVTFGSIVLLLFFTIGGGVWRPLNHYWLESDNPETLGDRPHYAYTPQPNWNAAYAFIKQEKENGDVIISSHPHFTKIFLNEAGYWIHYDYLGFDGRNQWSTNDKEFYVAATIIDDVSELTTITESSHGFIVFDYMAADGKIAPEILTYITTTFPLAFHEKTNPFSEVWVYRF